MSFRTLGGVGMLSGEAPRGAEGIDADLDPAGWDPDTHVVPVTP